VLPANVVPHAPAVLDQLQRLLASRDFDASSRGRALLHFLVGETLANRQASLSLATIAQRVFNRTGPFDSDHDPAVRIEVSRLRRALDRYNRLSGAGDPVLISLPRGASVPVARWAPGTASKPHEIGADLTASEAGTSASPH
jgi:hypothetical protein